MILRAGSGWQTVTADLALILFLVTAQASRETPAVPQQVEPVATAISDSSGAGLAVFRPGPETNLGQWLDMTMTDDRQGASVVVRYPSGQRDAAFRDGSALLEQIESKGSTARLVLEPGTRAETLVTIGYEGNPETGTMLAEKR